MFSSVFERLLVLNPHNVRLRKQVTGQSLSLASVIHQRLLSTQSNKSKVGRLITPHSLTLAATIATSLITASPARANLPLDALPDTLPPEAISLSCHDVVFGDFVPDQTPFGMTVGQNPRPKYSADTTWTATAPDGSTATLRTVAINNNSGKFIATGDDPDIFFVGFTDPKTGIRTPRLTEREGEPGDEWVLEIEYNRPISGSRVLLGDIDSQYVNDNLRFRDILEVESFLDATSTASSNTYVGSILVENLSGNKHTFFDDAL